MKECLRQQTKEDAEKEKTASWKTKSLYGMYHWQIEEEKSNQWLEKAGLKDSRGSYHGSTITSPKHQMDRGRVYHNRQNLVQAVQPCS